MSTQRDCERRLRVGLVGVGSHANRNILPALHFLPVDLVALCDLDEGLLRRTASEYRVDGVYTETARMYAEVGLDAVLLCVGPQQHPDLAVEALGAGLHVWMEKPPAMRTSQVDAMNAARAGRVCAVGFKKAYMPATRKAKELMGQADFGQLRSILAVYPISIPADGRGVLERGEYCNWLANGCHPLSLVLELGGDVRTVTTVRGAGEECAGAVFLHFASGAVGVLHLAAGAPGGCPNEFYRLYGHGRLIAIENSTRVVYQRGVPLQYGVSRDFAPPGTDTGALVWEASHRLATLENKALFVQGMVGELHDFCEAVLDGRPLLTCGLEFARHLMQVYEAALLSDGSPVELAAD